MPGEGRAHTRGAFPQRRRTPASCRRSRASRTRRAGRTTSTPGACRQLQGHRQSRHAPYRAAGGRVGRGGGGGGCSELSLLGTRARTMGGCQARTPRVQPIQEPTATAATAAARPLPMYAGSGSSSGGSGGSGNSRCSGWQRALLTSTSGHSSSGMAANQGLPALQMQAGRGVAVARGPARYGMGHRQLASHP